MLKEIFPKMLPSNIYLDLKVSEGKQVLFYFLVLLSLVFILFPLPIQAQEGSFTIQVGTYQTKEYAEEKFFQLTSNLKKQDRKFLRIEYIQGYYVVRLGLFPSRKKGKEHLKRLKQFVSDAFIIRTHVPKHELMKWIEKNEKRGLILFNSSKQTIENLC